jgi:hypothetical protein
MLRRLARPGAAAKRPPAQQKREDKIVSDQSEFVQAVRAALSSDGTVAQLEFTRANGTQADVQFPMALTTDVVLNIEKALGILFEKQRERLEGLDPRGFYPLKPKHVASFQGAVADGVPILSFVLEGNLRLDIALDGVKLGKLIAWLQEIAADAGKESPSN